MVRLTRLWYQSRRTIELLRALMASTLYKLFFLQCFFQPKQTQPYSQLSAMLDRSRQHDSANFGVGLGMNGVQSARNLTQSMVTMETRGKKRLCRKGLNGFASMRIFPEPLVNFWVSSKSLKRKQSFSLLEHDWREIVLIIWFLGRYISRFSSAHVMDTKMAVYSNQLQDFLNKVGFKKS